MPKSAVTFLMFQGDAVSAIELYRDAFPEAEFTIQEYPGGPMAGKVLRGEMKLCGQTYLIHDSSIKHAFSFTPSISVFLDVDGEEEFDRLFSTLSAGGGVMMAPNNYGFSRKFAWCADRFGVSWQINLP